MSSDRSLAFSVLLKIEKSGAYSNIELNKALRRSEAEDPAFIRELVYGVVKNKLYLDYYIDRLAAKGIGSINKDILIILRMGLYQIIFMDSVPEYAAVNETVELAKKKYRGRAGFVNGMIRGFLRKRDSIPGPEEIKDPVERLSVRYSILPGIVELLLDQMGEEKLEDFLSKSAETPPLYARVNTIRVTPEELKETLEADGVEASDTDHAELLELKGRDVISGKAFGDGLFYIQDAASYIAVGHLHPEPGEKLIDVCAAPGGKSFAAAIEMRDEGEILSMDVSGKKTELISREAKRLGLSSIETEARDALDPIKEKYGYFDKLICDVPCSGLGVIRRKPEIKYKDFLRSQDELYEKQLAILRASSAYLKDGGKLMYSTCTVNRKENEDIVNRFLELEPGYKLSEQELLLPGKGNTDGFFYSIIEKQKQGAGWK